MNYKQCSLIRPGPHGTQAYQVAWLPEQFAIEGALLSLKEDPQSAWDEGWIVDVVYATKELKNLLYYPPQAIRRHRDNTGDSLPKELK